MSKHLVGYRLNWAGRHPDLFIAATGWRRYAKIGLFVTKLLLHLLWWDLLFSLPILRWLRPSPRQRWQLLARRYCVLATDEGGLLVKLGQFLSLRFDLLPPVVIQELTALQDQIPGAPVAAIIAVIEADLMRPIDELFPWISPQPVASASVAQTHLARLPCGQHVVVKILRPGIAEQFETDLVIVNFIVRGLGQLRAVRKHIDLALLLDEFTAVTRRELDLALEGQHAERLTRNFANDPHIYIPKIYHEFSGRQTLTLENVAYLKLSDHDAITATGINQIQVAEQLTSAFLKQIFIHHFVHADPHPGNIFIKPQPHPTERKRDFALGPSGLPSIPYRKDRPFQIVLIDFGMAVEIPEPARAWLREFIIGLGLRDARRVVQSYATGNLLRPHVDVARVEEMTEALFQEFPNVLELLVGLMPDPDDHKTRRFFQEYSDLVQDYPFQIPMNLLFMYRALSTVGSVVKQLDPNFDLSAAATPFAIQLFWEELQQGIQDRLGDFTTLGQLLLTSPLKLDQLLLQAHKTFQMPEAVSQLVVRPWRNLSVKTEMTPQDRNTLEHLEGSIRRLTRTMMVLGGVMAGLLWYVGLINTDLFAMLSEQADRFGLLAMALSCSIWILHALRGQ